jgi:hypothetical protein
VTFAFLALSGAACSGPTAVELEKMPASCDAYVGTYESCVVHAAPSLPDIASVAKDRAALVSRALEHETQRAAALPPESRVAILAALATKCDENLQHLDASCHASRKATAGETR